jgi:hypothetical protein
MFNFTTLGILFEVSVSVYMFLIRVILLFLCSVPIANSNMFQQDFEPQFFLFYAALESNSAIDFDRGLMYG